MEYQLQTSTSPDSANKDAHIRSGFQQQPAHQEILGVPKTLPPARRIVRESLSLYVCHWRVFATIASFPFFFSALDTLWRANAPLAVAVSLTIFELLAAFFARLAFFSALAGHGIPEGGARRAYDRGIRMLPPFLWLSFLLVYVIAGGVFAFIVPGILLAVWMSMASYVLFLEGKRGADALARSWYYVRGFWGSVLWQLVFLAFLTFLLGISAGVLATGPNIVRILEDSGGSMGLPWYSDLFTSFLSNFFLFPFEVIYGYFVYQSLRAIKGDQGNPVEEAKLKKAIIAFFAVGVIGLVGLILFGGFAAFQLFQPLLEEGISAQDSGASVLSPLLRSVSF